ncbi:Ubiquitin domain [Arabidopsis suecica]|uniref:Ubiquitin domain n=1 Tax=Arabidopsis suecica TaxID=45249 RepID=A0A8T1ZF58_ARASU|nr:Ubiquitin domain [Arabidopsis suecica]
MDVIFETQDGYKFEIELGYWDTVLEIKQKIEKYQRIPVSTQTLVFQGNVLQDHLDIEQCAILNHSLLKVFVAPYSNPNHNNDQMLQTEKSPPLNSAKEIVNVQDLACYGEKQQESLRRA